MPSHFGPSPFISIAKAGQILEHIPFHIRVCVARTASNPINVKVDWAMNSGIRPSRGNLIIPIIKDSILEMQESDAE